MTTSRIAFLLTWSVLAALLWPAVPALADGSAPYDYRAHPVTATDPLAQGNWRGDGPQAAVDGSGGGSTNPFAYKAYVRRPWLNHYERKGHQDVGGAGWTDPWTPDCSETGAPTAEWPARLKLDYGRPVAAAKFAVYFPRQGNQDSYLSPTAQAALLRTVEILRSQDGRLWKSAVRLDRLAWTCPQVIEIPEPEPAPARFYILSVESMAPGNDALRIYEIETYLDPKAVIATEPIIRAEATRPEAPVLKGPGQGELAGGDRLWGWKRADSGFELEPSSPGASLKLPVVLLPDAEAPESPWQAAQSAGALLAAPARGGWASCALEADPLGVRLRVRMPPPEEDSARRFLYLRIRVPQPRVRFIPAYSWSRQPVKTAWPGHWLPTCMAAIETPEGTIALAPDSDRCRIGIQDEELTVCLFPDAGEASARLIFTPGNWWQAYRRVVEGVDRFKGPRQLRPAGQTAMAIERWLMDEKNWSEHWQMQRSFPASDRFYPEDEFFFILYGQPYTIPALWQRHLLTGDVKARERLDRIIAFLLESPVRVRQGPLAGGFYSTLAGSRQSFKLVDQAYNPWMTSQATGAALWSMLYHRSLSEERSEAVERAIAETADCLLRLQRPDGGWAYAHRERDGTVPSGDFVSSGSIWNVWALHRAGQALGQPRYLEGARRGKDWWIETFLNQHRYLGYWEDSNHQEVIYPTIEGYECSLAVLAFLEMGDAPRALEAARDLATWVQTRTVSYRDEATSLGHVLEQFTWPGDAYLAPQAGLAFAQICQATQDPFWKPYRGLAKTISWWCEPETGAMFFPLEAAAYLPLHRGPLTKTYWADWCGAQCASRTIWWLIDEINRRSGGRIQVDRDQLTGKILGEAGKAWLPEGGPSVQGAEGDQVNWMGYQTRGGYHLAILNDSADRPAQVTLVNAEKLNRLARLQVRIIQPGGVEAPAPPPVFGAQPIPIPAQALAIITWPGAGW